MKKLKDLIKESWLTGPNGTLKDRFGDIELGKVYTSKDMPPFQTPKQVNEADLEKGGSSLPSKLKNYMGRFTDEVNKAKLNKVKKVAILFKIIKSLGLNPQELSMYITKFDIFALSYDNSSTYPPLKSGTRIKFELKWQILK